MKRILFIDRDGTILREPEDEQIDSFEKFQFVPGAISTLRFLRRHTDYLFVLVSNQDGLGTPSYPESDFWPTHNLMLEVLHSEGWSSIPNTSTVRSPRIICPPANRALPC